MAFDFITAALNLGNTVLAKWIPDANLRQEASMALAQELNAQVMGQVAINQAEAASPSLFVAGWRPAIGWICGAAYGYNFVLQPFLVFALTAFHVTIGPLPVLDWSQLGMVLMGMLGLGAMRSYEKVQGGK